MLEIWKALWFLGILKIINWDFLFLVLIEIRHCPSLNFYWYLALRCLIFWSYLINTLCVRNNFFDYSKNVTFIFFLRFAELLYTKHMCTCIVYNSQFLSDMWLLDECWHLSFFSNFNLGELKKLKHILHTY